MSLAARLSACVALVALVALPGCGPRATPEPARAPLAVEFAGCAELHRGPRCLLPAEAAGRALVLWVVAPDAATLRVQVDGRDLAAREERLERGRRLQLTVPTGAQRLQLRSGEGAGAAEWSLALGAPAACGELAGARTLRASGEAAQALTALDGLAETATAAECGGARQGLRGRLLLELDRPEAALEALREAVTLHGAAGNLSGQVDDGLAMGWILTHALRDAAGARTVLAIVAAAVGGYGPGEARLPYYEGRLALEAGDLRGALGRLEEAARRAERLGMGRLRLHAEQARSEVLASLGRHGEAAELLQGLDSAGLAPCDQAALSNNLGWARLLARQGAEARGPLQQAVALYGEACPRAANRANARVNLALAALDGGARGAAEAEAALAAAQADDPEPAPRLGDWMVVVRGQIAEARGAWEEALVVWRGLAQEAPALSDARWRARLGEARALEALGRSGEAAVALAQAEDAVDAALQVVPLGEGRASYAGERDEAARRLVALLVAAGRPAEAATAARRSMARVVATLARVARVPALGPEQQAAWERALADFRRARERVDGARLELRTAAVERQGELEQHRGAMERDARAALDAAYAALDAPYRSWTPRAPRPGVLLLVYFPGADGLWGFSVREGGARAVALGTVNPAATPQQLGKALLAPFDAELAVAKRVELIAPGALRAVDLHALPWRERPLLAHVPVAWALDLPRARRTAEGAPETALGALVVSDPRGNLPAARRDGEATTAALSTRAGLKVIRLDGRKASREAVLGELPRAELLHFAGHAVFGGAGGWGASLGLASGGQLTVADVLGLRHTPRRVILSGCETARSPAAQDATTLGLGQAFVAAGADEVIAASRVVDDEDAARLSAALYAGPIDDTAAALRRAQLAVAEACPSCDWAAWRALGP